MKTSMKTMLAALAMLLSAGLMAAEGWGTNFKKAIEEGRAKKLPVLMVFSGSDWCQPCISLDRDILKKKSFIEEASKKYILFNADYPINTRLGQELQAQNKSLAAKYSIYSFPTVVVIDPNSERILAKESGFAPGTTAKTFLEHFDAKVKSSK